MRSSGINGWADREAAVAQNEILKGGDSHRRGQIAVVGIGPGHVEAMSQAARAAIEAADVVVGYDTYLKLASEVIGAKEIFGSGMMQEIERCQAAVDLAMAGRKVAVISSGDPGIYGMAGLVLELAMQQPPSERPEVTVIPGISAVSAAAALLGAPLMHDFAVISLSDLLTPWEVIRKRVEMAAAADFVIALYNPKSVRRVTQIEEVREIVLQHRATSTPVGIVRHATRPDERQVIARLDTFTQEYIDMFSLVIIGNSQTVVREGRMITPRGYQL